MDQDLKQCFQYCRQHDDEQRVGRLNFSECYVLYMVKADMRDIYAYEFTPVDPVRVTAEDIEKSQLILPARIHHINRKPQIDKLIHQYIRKCRLLDKIIFRFANGNASDYYLIDPIALKTLQGRLRMPTYMAIETAMILAKNIDEYNIHTRYILYKEIAPHIYIIQAVFSAKPHIIPWQSWEPVFRDAKLLSWQDNDYLQLRLDITGLAVQQQIKIPDALGMEIQLILDNTGHIANSMRAGLFLKQDPNAHIICAEKELKYQSNIKQLYEDALLSNLVLFAAYIRWLEQSLDKICNIFTLLSSNLDYIVHKIGKKTTYRLLECSQTYTVLCRTRYDLLYFFLYAALFYTYKDQGQQRFAECGQDILRHLCETQCCSRSS